MINKTKEALLTQSVLKRAHNYDPMWKYRLKSDRMKISKKLSVTLNTRLSLYILGEIGQSFRVLNCA